MSSVRLFGVVPLEGWHGSALAPNTEVVPFRDIGAVVDEVPYARGEITEGTAAEHHTVIGAVFVQRPVLPAPLGVVFRSREVLLRWMELHYVTLHDALGFIEGRIMGRVYIWERDGASPAEESDPIAAASECFRVLRRNVVGAVPLKPEHDSQLVLGGSFLLDRDRWEAFSSLVEEEERRLPALKLELTGPWPPYDFVRMQFGG